MADNSPLLSPPKQRDIPFMLACVISAAFVLALMLLAFHPIPTGNETLFDTFLTMLGTAFTGVVGYFFGSSSSSKSKDATIQAQAAQIAQPAATGAVP